MRLLESQNLYPECLCLDLNLNPITGRQFDLDVSLNFSQQWQSLLDGRIKFGLKGGKLSLKLEQGAIALTDADFGEAFTTTTQITATEPSWRLDLKTSQSVFQGNLEAINLGKISKSGDGFHLTAIFAIFAPDLSLTDAEGLWKHDINPNQHGVLERKLAQFLWQTKFTPYLSRVQWGTGTRKTGGEWEDLTDKPGYDAHLSQLKALIEAVYRAKTNDFWELARLAGLNPRTDFAGGNLLGAELSGLELGGANLYHVNLRGADLTDADLSEANLNHARLSGADLSGAYLGSANLSHANFHRASLALANLIGADLRGANLQEANLSQANLSGARVEKAIFGDNPGMTPALEESLQARGAKII